jgi:radical SAM superfamily enzyme YgiQ (UPF0313 family)
MAKALLINPSYQDSYGSAKAAIVDPIFPTVGLLSIAAMAEKEGHEIQILDMSVEQYNYQNVIDRVEEFKPDVVGITGTTPLMNQIRDMSVLIKEQYPNIKVIAGGAHVTSMPYESMVESMLDMVVVGEGEFTFVDILNDKDPADILGIYYRTETGEILKTGFRPFIQNLDDLPMPAFHLYDSEYYKDKISRLLAKRRPLAMLEFSRGCIYKCDFCASKMTMAFGYRKKSPERCAEEVKLLEKYGYKEFALADDIFTSDNKWAINVSNAIIDTKVDMLWTCTNGIRVESADDTLFQTMRKAGCYRVSFGFETGNERVLKEFGKGGKATLEQGIEAVKMARKAGIDANGFFMLGLSPDTEESMMDTINYARKLPLDMLKFGLAIGFPGTKMFNENRRKNLIRSYNWDDYFIYSSKPLFAHPNLSFDVVQKHMNIAYKKAILQNPGFIIRRLIRGIRTLEFFWDFYYFIKFFFSPSVSNQESGAKYYASERWPKFDWENTRINVPSYRTAQNKIGDKSLENKMM